MTEDEAKTKWCPMFRRAGGGDNSDADGGRRTKCIASECMMWRDSYCGLAGSPSVQQALAQATSEHKGRKSV